MGLRHPCQARCLSGKRPPELKGDSIELIIGCECIFRTGAGVFRIMWPGSGKCPWKVPNPLHCYRHIRCKGTYEGHNSVWS
jgi:hypothetical protein